MVNVTHTLDVAEILRPPIQWVTQKFCNHSYTGCTRNSAAIYTLSVVENSVSTLTLDIAETKFATTHTLGVAEILRPFIQWM